MRKKHGFSEFLRLLSRKILPLAAGVALLALSPQAEPDPGYVDGLGLAVDKMGRVRRYNLPDPAFEKREDLKPILSRSELRAIEPVRTIREVLPDGRIMLKGGRPIALIGCIPDTTSTAQAKSGWKKWSGKLPGKVLRLLFEKQTRDRNGDLAAYAFLSDGRLLNELLLLEGLARLDTQANLSPQYRLRYQKAEEHARESGTGLWSGTKQIGLYENSLSRNTKLSEYRNGFLGIPPGATTSDRQERSGKDESARGHLFPRDSHQPPDAQKP
jgi:hypothetical protein